MGNTEQTHLYGSQENCLRAAINRLDMEVFAINEAYVTASEEIYQSGLAAGRAAKLEAEQAERPMAQAGEESSYTPYKNMPSRGPSNYKPYKYECSQEQSDAIEKLSDAFGAPVQETIAILVDGGLHMSTASEFRCVVTDDTNAWFTVRGRIPGSHSDMTIPVSFQTDLLTEGLRERIRKAKSGTFRLKILIMEDGPQVRSAFDAEGVAKNIVNYAAELCEARNNGGDVLNDFEMKRRMEACALRLVRPLTNRIAELEARVRK